MTLVIREVPNRGRAHITVAVKLPMELTDREIELLVLRITETVSDAVRFKRGRVRVNVYTPGEQNER